ncbi:MAG: glycosyltransferase family 4 protein [Opitutae bacterium]|nr:glycosyltransferase family 4 protein [Opitutae bacterium]
MKIGFDVAQTCSERAGCAWYADSLVRELVVRAPGHQFFLYHQFGDWINSATEQGTHISAPNVTSTFTDITPQEAARIWRSPAELVIKTGAPDIVHANSFRAPRVPGARTVFTVYDVSFWAVPHFATEQNRLACQGGLLQALGTADGFIFISENAHTEFERILPGWIEENNRLWQVTPLAARPSFALPPAPVASGTPPYWLAVGSLEPRKNYLALLDALEIYWPLSASPQPLWLAGGDGWNSADVRERITVLSGRGMVRRLGYVPDAKLSELYSSATALIFPSWYEGFGLPVLEAMALGCPILCSDRSSLPEVGGDAVLYIDPARPGTIADAMLRLEKDPALRANCVAANRARAEKFSWQHTADATLEFYDRVLRRPT